MSDRIGQQIGSYRLVSVLGSGGFAEVYLGQHVHIHLQAAIKVLRTQLGQNYQAEFLQEANTIALLKHPHIIRILDFGIERRDLAPYLIMDYAPYGTLRNRHPKGSIIPLITVIPYVKQIAQALQHAHDRNLIHRDLKPENLLIGENEEILLSDFGIAALAHSTSTMQTAPYAGTIPYSAPEQILGQPRRESDQYALGIILYEWLTGDRPFQGTVTEIVSQHLGAAPDPIREKVPDTPPAVETVTMRALAKDPHQRFESIQAFADALEQAFASSHVAPEIQSVLPPTQADQLATMETEASIASSSSMTVLAEVPTTSRPLTPASVSHLARHRGAPPDRRTLFILLLVLLVMLSGGSLYYFGVVARTPTLSPAQATATAVAQPYAAGTASMFGFDAAHTHNNPYERTLNPGNVTRLMSLWSFSTQNGIFSSPTVASGMVYIGSADHNLYAFDASCRNACQPLWSFDTGKFIDSSPAVAGGMVYIGSYDGKLYAFDASCRKDCLPLWSFATGGFIRSSPAVANGIVYVGSTDHRFYAFGLVG
jgi:eukaryotic-like serine/threonine-protein kinase